MNEIIEAAKAVLARWDSTDWKAAPTAEVMNRLRAALSANPGPLPEVDNMVSAFLLCNKQKMKERDSYGDTYRVVTFYDADDVADFIPALIAALTTRYETATNKYKSAHDALDDALIVSMETTLDNYPDARSAINALACQAIYEAEDEKLNHKLAERLVAAEAKGRREALMDVSIGLIGAAVDRDQAPAGCMAVLIGDCDRIVTRLIESARAAQAEHNNGAGNEKA